MMTVAAATAAATIHAGTKIRKIFKNNLFNIDLSLLYFLASFEIKMIIGGGLHYISLKKTFFENFIRPTTEILMFWIFFHQNSWDSIFEQIQVFWVTRWCVVASPQPTYDRRLWKPNPFWATTRHSSMTISPKVLFSSATHPFAECKKRCYLPKYSLSLVSSRQMDSFPTFLASKVKVNKSETLLLLSSRHHKIIVSDLDLDMG